MLHTRGRQVVSLLLKKLAFMPIVAMQGPRQTGKSFMGREILPLHLASAHYLTLDEKSLRLAAQNSSDDFLQRYPAAHPLILDEVQKSPDIFDAIKLSVDQKRVPGKFVLLGSTEFSRLSRIRESLTGRMSRIRVFPFNVSESLSLPMNPELARHFLNKSPRVRREDVHLHLNQGGLPGLFSIRSGLEKEQALTDLLDLILYRDARLARWFDPELGKDILEQIAKLEVPSLAEIASALTIDSRRVKRHLEVLRELFVIHQLDPHRLGYGKSLFFIYDCAIAKFLGADQMRLIQTWFLNEQLSQKTYRGELKWKIHYYSTQKGSRVDFIIEADGEIYAIKLIDQSHVRKIDTLILKKLVEKSQATLVIQPICVGPFSEYYVEDGIQFFPFEAVV